MIPKNATRLFCVILAGSVIAGCEGPKPFLLEGDASSAEVGYSLSLAGTTDVAKQHCARYERVPHFLQAQEDVAYFDCVKP